VASQPQKRARKSARTLALLVAMLVLAAPAPAWAQSRTPTGDVLDPVLQLVCDLTGLLCPPSPPPARPVPAAPVPPPEAPAAPSDLAQPPSSSVPNDAMLQATIPESVPLPAPGADPAPQGPAAAPGSPAASGIPAGPATGLPAEPALPLPRPAEVDLSPRSVAVATGVSIFGLILIGFPAELFNKSLRENYDRFRQMFRIRAKDRPAARPSLQVLALIASAAVAGSLAAMQRLNAEWTLSAMLTVALAVGLGFLLTTAVYELAGLAVTRRLGMPRRVFRTYPAGLPVVAFFVAISTLGQLHPAYLYGHLAGFRQEGEHNTGTRGPALQTLVSCAALLVFCLLCWALRAVVTASPWTDILAGATVVGLNRLVFSLIPVTFLEGVLVYRYSRPMWAAIYGSSVLGFVLLVLLPATRNAPPSAIGAAAVPFVIFVALSLGVWAFFRRSQPSAQPA
jgi:hypothetical protein